MSVEHFQQHGLGLLSLVALGEHRWAWCSFLWGRVPSAVAIFSFPSWGDLTKVAGKPSAVFCGHFLLLLKSSGHKLLLTCTIVTPDAQSCGGHAAAWESSLVHIFTYMLLEECLLVETLREYSGAPEKHPENVSNSSALSAAVKGRRQRQRAIVGAEPQQHCASKGTALRISRMCPRFLSPFVNEAYCLKKGFLIL